MDEELDEDDDRYSYNCVIVDVDIPWFSAFVLALKLSLSFGAVEWF